MTACFHIDCLKNEFEIRRAVNPRYSYSAFSRDIKISRGALSEILSGQRNISYRNCHKIFSKFKWSSQKEKEFIYSAAKSLLKYGVQRLHPEFRRALLDKEHVLFDPYKIKQEDFSLIHQWYYIAILEITFTQKYTKSDYAKIATRLGLSDRTVKKAIMTLLHFGYLEIQNGHLCKAHRKLTLSDPNKTSKYLIKHQEQILTLAKRKLRKTPLEERSHSGMAMAIDPENLPQARQEIRLFLYRMSELLEKGSQNKLYQLQVNLFPLET